MPQQPPKPSPPREPSAVQILTDCADYSLVTARQFLTTCTDGEAAELLALDQQRIAGELIGPELRLLLDNITDRLHPPPAVEASPDDDTVLLTPDS